MLSPKHLGAYQTLTRENVKTTAGGLKCTYDVTDGTKSFYEHVEILCQIAILERIANGEDVRDPFEVDLPLDIADYVPEVLKVFLQNANMMLGLEHIKFQILDAFREAYLFVHHLYPQLEVEEQAT